MLDIWLHLCPDCKHERTCPGPNVQPSAGGGITCADFAPRPDPQSSMSDAHILALPDREPCAECACRKGSIPNGSPHTIARFTMCVQNREPFLCHGDGGFGRVCAGWLRAVKARAEIEDAETIDPLREALAVGDGFELHGGLV